MKNKSNKGKRKNGKSDTGKSKNCKSDTGKSKSKRKITIKQKPEPKEMSEERYLEKIRTTILKIKLQNENYCTGDTSIRNGWKRI